MRNKKKNIRLSTKRKKRKHQTRGVALEPNAIVNFISLAARAGQPRQLNTAKEILTLEVRKLQRLVQIAEIIVLFQNN